MHLFAHSRPWLDALIIMIATASITKYLLMFVRWGYRVWAPASDDPEGENDRA